MRTKDIAVGGHYAYAHGTWATAALEVEVLATGIETRTRSDWPGYSRGQTQKNGVNVKFVKTGKVATVLSREIVRSWAEQAELNEARTEYTRKKFNADKERALRRATLAYRLEPILQDNGYEPKAQYVPNYDSHPRVALEAAGYPGQAGPYRDTQKDHFVSAVPDLGLLMSKGHVTEDVLDLLLTKIEEQR